MVFQTRSGEILNNSEVLKSIQDIFKLEVVDVYNIYSILDPQVPQDRIGYWLLNKSDPSFEELKDIDLTTFLNAFICEKRGKKRRSSAST